jgi:hypothetical protein
MHELRTPTSIADCCGSHLTIRVAIGNGDGPTLSGKTIHAGFPNSASATSDDR